MRAGAIGCCAARLSEAEVFAESGIPGLLITTAVIGRDKIARAVALADQAPDTIFVVDDRQNVRDINDAAGSAAASRSSSPSICSSAAPASRRASRRSSWRS